MFSFVLSGLWCSVFIQELVSMSRKGVVLVIVGILLLIVGIAGYFVADHYSTPYESFGGQLYRATESSGQNEYAGLKAVKYASIVMAILGGALLIVGLIVGINRRVPAPEVALRRQQTTIYCTNCGAERVTGHSSFCKKCGQRFS